MLMLKTKSEEHELFMMQYIPPIGSTVSVDGVKYKIIDIEFIFENRQGLMIKDIVLTTN